MIQPVIDAILRSAKNKWVWLRVLILVIVGFCGSIFFVKTKQGDCASCEADRSELINALIDFRTDLAPETLSSSAIEMEGDEGGEVFSNPVPMVAAFSLTVVADTTKPIQQQKILKVLSRIDSLLIKYKADTIKKTKT